jgi:hypothetical protein
MKPTETHALGTSSSGGGLLLALLLTAWSPTPAVADIVYVTATCSNASSTTVCGSAVNLDYNNNGVRVYTDTGAAYTLAVSSKPDGPVTPGARYFSNSFSNSTPNADGFTLSPGLGTTGGVYKVYHVFSSGAINISTNLVVGVTNVEGCTLSFSQTRLFQSSYGNKDSSGKHVYQMLGYLTNNADTAYPKLRFYYVSGTVSSGSANRLVVDTFKFQLHNPWSTIVFH